MVDILIVGAGTAGLTAAVYGCRAGRSVLVLEELSYGGQIINTPDIENYPGIAHVTGYDFATALFNQAKELGAQVSFENVLSVENLPDKKVVHTNENTYEAKTVILATGVQRRLLGVEREKDLTGSGVSYCATCDGMFYRGKEVVVVGGGNTALEDAAFLANLCSKVTLVHRRDAFRGDETTVENLKARDNVQFLLNSNVTAILGNDRVEGVEVANKVTGEKTTVPAAGLFIAVGQVPDNKRFENLADLSPEGYFVADESCKTRTEGVFVAGDCRTKQYRQLATAASDGAAAALAASAYLG